VTQNGSERDAVRPKSIVVPESLHPGYPAMIEKAARQAAGEGLFVIEDADERPRVTIIIK